MGLNDINFLLNKRTRSTIDTFRLNQFISNLECQLVEEFSNVLLEIKRNLDNKMCIVHSSYHLTYIRDQDLYNDIRKCYNNIQKHIVSMVQINFV